MRLCSVCNRANGSAFPEGECEICGGAALRLDAMAAEGCSLLRADGSGTFSISTLIAKDWLAREERAFDTRLAGAESVKSFLNREIAGRIERETGAEYGPEGGVKLVFDFGKGAVELRRNCRFFFGRYRKLSAGLSQSRWRCAACDGKGCQKCGGRGRMYDSVEERIGEPFRAHLDAGGYVLHASGREDVDATNSAGRPFVLEVANPKGGRAALEEIEAAVSGKGDVTVSGLREVPRAFVEIVTESHFDKAYEADVRFGREVGGDELMALRSLEGKTLLQRTPKRVAHRRADIVRHRKVKHIEAIRRDSGDLKAATLIIRAEAGTYIKELISGDGGRTEPSVSGLLGADAACTRLEVVLIDDGYLDFCLERYPGPK